MSKTYTLRIFRGHPGKQYWEEFVLPLTPLANVISALMEIQRKPINKKGEKVAPVVWEAGCLEEVCGSCSMLINGYPRQACTALIEPMIEKTGSDLITVAPMTKFPLVRDLIIDRSVLFENLKKVRAWIAVDSSRGSGPGPKISPRKQEVMYALSTCMSCGVCSEGCPQVNPKSKFMSPAIFSQVRLFNAHPVGKMEKSGRLQAVMGEGGIQDCGNAQNCVKVCPKKIPLTDSIAAIFRSTFIESIQRLLSFPDSED